VNPRGGRAALAALALGVGLPAVLSSCGGGPSRSVLTTTTTTTTTTITTTTVAPSSTTTTEPGVVLPNVVGQKILAARNELHAAGFKTVGLNTPCNKGTLQSQSVVSSLAIPGKAPARAVGAVALAPGAALPAGTLIGINWSGCYGSGSTVPTVVGLAFGPARHALMQAGLTWACFSVGRPATTTTRATATSTTLPPSTTETTRPKQTVLTQNPAPGAMVEPGTTVSLTMHACPQ
jgi:hypothetical protein